MKAKFKKSLAYILAIAIISTVFVGAIPAVLADDAEPAWNVVKTNYGVEKASVATAFKSKNNNGTELTVEPYLIASAKSVLKQSGNVGTGNMEYKFDITVDSSSITSTTTQIYIGLTGGNYISEGGWNNVKIIGCGLGFLVDVVNKQISFFMPRSANNDTTAYFPIQNSWGSRLSDPVAFSLNAKHRISVRQDNNKWSNGGRAMVVTVDETKIAEFSLIESGTNNATDKIFADAWLFNGIDQNIYVATNDSGNNTNDDGERAKVLMDLTPNAPMASGWSVVRTNYGAGKFSAVSANACEDGTELIVEPYLLSSAKSSINQIGNVNEGRMQYAFDISIDKKSLSSNTRSVFVGLTGGDYYVTEGGWNNVKIISVGMGFDIDVVNSKISFYMPRSANNDTTAYFPIQNSWGSALGDSVDFALNRTHRVIIKQDNDRWTNGGRAMVVTVDGIKVGEFSLLENGTEDISNKIFADAWLFNGAKLNVFVATNDDQNNTVDDGERAKVKINLNPSIIQNHSWDYVKTVIGAGKTSVATDFKYLGNGITEMTVEPYLIASAKSTISQNANKEYAFDVLINKSSITASTTQIYIALTGGNYISNGAYNCIHTIGTGLAFIINTDNAGAFKEQISLRMPRTSNITTDYFNAQDSFGDIAGGGTFMDFKFDVKHRIVIKQDGDRWTNGGRAMIVTVDGTKLGEFSLLETGAENKANNIFVDPWLFNGADQNIYFATNDQNNDGVDNNERAKIQVNLYPDAYPEDINGDWSVDANDVIILREYILGKDTVSANFDINNDGNADLVDLIRMKKILAGNTYTVHISQYENFATDTEAFQTALDEISTQIMVDKLNKKQVQYILKLRNKKYILNDVLNVNFCNGLTIEGNGATIIGCDNATALSIKGTSGLTLKNITFDYNNLPYTQGIIQSISGNDYVMAVDAGYRTDRGFIVDDKAPIYMNLHDAATGAFLENSSVDYTVTDLQTQSGNKFAFKVAENGCGRVPQVGDLISIYQRGAATIAARNTSNITLDNVKIYSSGGFAYSEQRGNGNTTLKNCAVVPGPKPAGATRNRVRSSNADATHFQLIANGPTIDNCTFTHCGDDAVNVHGFFYYVSKIEGADIYLSPKYTDTMPAKDSTLDFYDGSSFEGKGNAVITSVNGLRDAAFAETNEALWEDSLGGCADAELVYKVQLNASVANIAVGDIVSCREYNGSGTVIKNSTFGYNRARGILLKCSDAVVKDNEFTGTSKSAIVVAAEPSWGESGFGSNIQILNNTVTNCANDAQATKGDGANLGSIEVILPTDGFKTGKEYKNIKISGNTITDSGTYGIFVSNASNIEISKNNIVNPFAYGINQIGDSFGIAPNSGIFVGMTNGGTITENVVTSSNNSITSAVQVADNCSNVTADGTNGFSR